jgi:hypothetical protein
MLIATGVAYTLGVIHSNLALWIYVKGGASFEVIYTAFSSSPLHNLIGHAINAVAAVIGGYWAAKHALARPFQHAALAGLLMLIPVCAAVLVPYTLPQPTWSVVLSFLVPLPSALAGALYIALTH